MGVVSELTVVPPWGAVGLTWRILLNYDPSWWACWCVCFASRRAHSQGAEAQRKRKCLSPQIKPFLCDGKSIQTQLISLKTSEKRYISKILQLWISVKTMNASITKDVFFFFFHRVNHCKEDTGKSIKCTQRVKSTPSCETENSVSVKTRGNSKALSIQRIKYLYFYSCVDLINFLSCKKNVIAMRLSTSNEQIQIWAAEQ